MEKEMASRICRTPGQIAQRAREVDEAAARVEAKVREEYKHIFEKGKTCHSRQRKLR